MEARFAAAASASSSSSSSSSSANPHIAAPTPFPPKKTTKPKPRKRPSQDDIAIHAKIIKPEPSEDYSKAVQKKLASSTRTGQACDRCKSRKIRCDGLPGGCSQCIQSNEECVTSDRITGRPTPRGYVEDLERKNAELEQKIKHLEHQVSVQGLPGAPGGGTRAYGQQQQQPQPPQQPAPTWTAANAFPPPPPPDNNGLSTAPESHLPAVRADANGSMFLGVSQGNAHVSAIKGTSLKILGMEIDIADFVSSDMDEPNGLERFPLFNKSYQSFLYTILNINPRPANVSLPPKEEGLTMLGFFLTAIHPFLPLLHAPTQAKLLNRFYDDPTFQPTAAQYVMVHTVFAIIYFHLGVRRRDNPAESKRQNELSNLHYHYALSLFHQMASSRTVQDVQALTLLCAHLRNFPKPGASWILIQTTMTLAIELGMHLSASRWGGAHAINPLDIEMRKRTFWCLLTIHVTLAGKLGRPIGLRMEEFDVEIPESLDDDLLTEDGLDASRAGTCLHEIGLQAMRLIPICMDMYSTVYAVRRDPANYIATVTSLESRIAAWKQSIPAHLTLAEAHHRDRMFAIYAEIWFLEFRLLLRHPSAEMTTDKRFKAESMQVCLDCSTRMVNLVTEIQAWNSLDTTWYNTAVYILAITTRLFANYEKSNTEQDILELQEEMAKWVSILREQGQLLGSGDKLAERVLAVINCTIGMLRRKPDSAHAHHHAASAPESKPQIQRATSAPNPNITHPYGFEQPSSGTSATPPIAYAEDGHAYRQTPYPPATQFSPYTEAGSPATIAYTSQSTSHAYPAYSTANSTANEAPLPEGFALQVSQAQGNGDWRSSPIGGPGQQAWQHWTNSVAGQFEPHDGYDTGAALLQQGGFLNALPPPMGIPQTTIVDMAGIPAHAEMGQHLTGQVAWPLNLYDTTRTG